MGIIVRGVSGLIAAALLFVGFSHVIIAGQTGSSDALVRPIAGVNLAGAEFGGNVPGTYGWDYVYPSAEELDYYRSKGITLVRLPFRWERLQRCLYCPLDEAELNRVNEFVSNARTRGMQAILDPHNYARYNGHVIGTPEVPNSAFADFWRRLAAYFANESAIWAYGLMNEPHDTGGLWPAAAQAAVDAIREVDMTHRILVPGDGWSGAHSWTVANADLSIDDPANNFLYEAHQYFDADSSGTYRQSYDEQGAYPNIGVDRVRPFVEWLEARDARGFIGEYGVPDSDPRWLTVMDNFLEYLSEQGIGSTYWAGGPWWGDYPLSIEPRNGRDRPQMAVLTGYASGSLTGFTPEVAAPGLEAVATRRAGSPTVVATDPSNPRQLVSSPTTVPEMTDTATATPDNSRSRR